jgi:hypothetical protein
MENEPGLRIGCDCGETVADPAGPTMGRPSGPSAMRSRGAAMARRAIRFVAGAYNRVSVMVVLVAVLGSGALVWRASDAAFTGSTSNGANNWNAGKVSLSDDDSTTAMFSTAGAKPGSYGEKCIVITFTGNIASSVKLYAANYTGTLGPYISLLIEKGTAGDFSSCGTGWTGTSVYSGTLSGFATASTTFATGVGTFTPSTNGTTAVYRFTWMLTDDNAAKSLTSGCDFTWEAQNT